MPMHDFKCLSCQKEFEAFQEISSLQVSPICSHCGGETVKLWCKKSSQVHLFPEGFWEDIASEPIYISSRRQLRRECEKHEVYSKYLEGGYTR